MNFSRTQDIDQKLERFISRERLEKYLSAKNGDISAAISLYEHNSRLSEAFYTPLQSLEICLRNALNEQLTALYGNDWLTNGAPPFDQNTQDWIDEAITDLGGLANGVGFGHVVAELKLAFWVSLLAPRYDSTVWRAGLYKAFIAKGGKSRGQVHSRLNALRRFRNRVAHHEPIFHRNLDETHKEIIETIEWICRDTSKWAASLSRYDEVKVQISN